MKFIEDQLGEGFAIATGQSDDGSNDPSYQIMPDHQMDEYVMEYNFFDWYCFKYENKQFFKCPFEAVGRYIVYRKWWIDNGGPKAFTADLTL